MTAAAPRDAHASWASLEGLPFPLGATWVLSEEAWNFAIYSEHAEQVTLLLYAEADPSTPVVAHRLDHLRNKSGPVWHCRVRASEMADARFYAYYVDGARSPRHPFDPDKVLFDPYARALHFPLGFDRKAAIGSGANAGRAPLGLIAAGGARFDWGDDRRPRHEASAVIYERQAKNFLCLLLLANGTPMLRAGDEFFHTQGGNNNPYNQDNETRWLDWRRLDAHADAFRFARLMIAFRKATLRSAAAASGATTSAGTGWVRRWICHPRRAALPFACAASPSATTTSTSWSTPTGGRSTSPCRTERPAEWCRVVDTGRESPDDIREPGQEARQTSARYAVGPRSVGVLLRPRRS